MCVHFSAHARSLTARCTGPEVVEQKTLLQFGPAPAANANAGDGHVPSVMARVQLLQGHAYTSIRTVGVLAHTQLLRGACRSLPRARWLEMNML
jgi:hypothetical protein